MVLASPNASQPRGLTRVGCQSLLFEHSQNFVEGSFSVKDSMLFFFAVIMCIFFVFEIHRCRENRL